jgi:hypothetical protein
MAVSTFDNSLRTAALALLSAALLWPSPGLAQRKVLTPGGKQPAADAKPDEAKPDEAKKDDAKPAQTAPPAAQPDASEPSDKPSGRQPVGSQPKKEVPAAPPTVLVPKDEEGPKKDTKASPNATPRADEVLYRKKLDKTVVTLHVRPAKPVPGRTTTLLFEVVKVLAVPDPALGDRVPLENAVLFATIGREGGPQVRFRLHAMPDAGVYGVHFAGAEAGVYRLLLEQRLENAEIGEKPLTTDFSLGVGQDTPMQAADDESAVKAGRGRTALHSGESSAESVSLLMRSLGDSWMALAQGSGDAAAAAKAITDAAAKLAGQVPTALSSSRREFDTLAGELAASLKELPGAAGDSAKARALIAKVEVDQCARCHVKFRFQLTDDVSAWPKFTPKTPKSSGGPRRPVK